MSTMTLDANGITYDDYPTVLVKLQASYRQIYGDDVYLEADSQDGQWLAVVALAQYDLMQIASHLYSSFSPQTAQGDALSRNVKINGISRRVASNSTVDLRIVGQVGATITNGIAQDTQEQKWILPSQVVIPASGEITVTATAENAGDITAQANTVNKIATPTLGWQTVNNPQAATPGAAIEQDAELRRRQTYSVALPSKSIFEGTVGAVADVEGVTRVRGYENDSNITDANGIPGHHIAIVVEGGDAQAIADAIAIKKTPGTGTYGTTSVTTYDEYGMPNTINFYRPTVVQVAAQIDISPLPGYLSSYADEIKAAVAAMINGLGIGEDVLKSKLYVPANLPCNVAFNTFDIVNVMLSRDGDPLAETNIDIAFNEVAQADLVDVVINVL